MRWPRLRRLLRKAWLVRHYPARFRTTRHQHIAELTDWFRDQWDAESRGFDARFGTSTSWFDLDNYEPVLPSVVRDVLGRVPHAGTTFVDLGSGKGRAVLIASQLPFARVVGVEHRWLLHWRAGRNLAAFRRATETLAPVELVHGDARRWAFPDGPVVVFLYNPFPGHVLRSVLLNVRHPDTWVVYVNPIREVELIAAGFEVIDRDDHPAQDRCWRIYARPGPEAVRSRSDNGDRSG